MKTSENAVSPVIGVMLMLVVTIIIAAVVSAYSGGLASQNDKAPIVQLSAAYSQADGLTISHNGGDPISTKYATIYVKNSKNLGTEYYSWKLNLSQVSDANGKYWDSGKGSWGFKAFTAGDTIFVKSPYHLPPDWPVTDPPQSSSDWYNNTANVGKTFWIKFMDQSGKEFASTEVVITK
jgi:FlaG/FlaF family flagellin (archaellin)